MPGATINGSPASTSVASLYPSIIPSLFTYEGSGAIIGLGNVSSKTIISGGTVTLGVTVANLAAEGGNLDYKLGSAVQSGSATLGAIISSTGSLAPSASQSSTVSATSTNLGINTISFTARDNNASNSPQTTSATLTVLGHAVPSLSVTNQTVIIGATGVSLSLSNGTSGHSGLASLDVNSLGYGVSGLTGGALVASGSTQAYTAAITASTLGTQIDTFSMNVGDDHSLSGASAATDLSTSATLTVLGHAAPSLSVVSGNNQTVIVGAAGITAGLNLSNGTLHQSGLASLDVNSLGSGVGGSTGYKLIASGSIQPYTASLSTGTLGPQTQMFSINVGDDHTLSGASAATNLSTSATLTVLDHSNASLSSTANQTAQTLNFGNVLRGATVPSQRLTIYNRAANTSATNTANLKLTGFSAPGDTDFTTTLSPFGGLSAAGGYVTYTASLNTGSNTTTGVTTITMSASQLVDDSGLSGAGNNNNGTLTITLSGNVGNATADASNLQTSFGTALTAPVAQNASYANLASTVIATTGSGGSRMVGTTATILAGANSLSGSSETVSMAWRTRTQGERLVSDVLDLSGMGMTGGTGHTSPFVLRMDYAPDLLGGNELVLASEEMIQLDWLNPATGTWQNAIDGNYGTNVGTFHLGAWQTDDMTLGDWGVNTTNDTVWAVVNYNGDFAVVPEPSTLVLLGVGAIGLGGWAWRRRRQRE